MCRINEFHGYSRDATLLTEAVKKYSHIVKYLCIVIFSVSLVSCVRGSSATEIKATIRAKINGADVTELTAHDVAGNPQTDAACTTNVIENDYIQLILTFDETSPTCGIVQVFRMKFRLYALCIYIYILKAKRNFTLYLK